jgi:gamma-glutamyltranspeptidase/glutathione hydrolase
LLQVLFDSILWSQNAENAVEMPRFQTEHLVKSFDNHAMAPGSLYLDERIPSEVAADLGKRGHKITVKSRYDSGTAPVLIRLHPTGLIEAGADPFYFRASQAW